MKRPASSQVCKFIFSSQKKVFFQSGKKQGVNLLPSFSIFNSQFSFIIVFRIISLSKSRLAGLYFPESSQAVATNRLMRWVHGCRPLMAELEAAGYSRSQKWLTVRQVALIVAHLGEP